MEQEMAAHFEQRVQRFTRELKAVEQTLDRVAWTRLAVFVIGGGLEVWSWRLGGLWWLLFLVLLLLGFGLAVRWNQQVLRLKKFLQIQKGLNEAEIRRLKADFAGLDGAVDLADPTHPYSGDMDLYGDFSLWQLLSRVTSVYGKRSLARWLGQAASPDVIAERQEASRLLAPEVDWRQELQATGLMTEDPGISIESLEKWLTAEPVMTKRPLFQVLPWVQGAINATLIGLWIAGVIPYWVAPAGLILGVLMNGQIGKLLVGVYEETDEKARLLRAYTALIEQIEAMPAKGALMQSVHQQLSHSGDKASHEIKNLIRILRNMELHLNGLPYFLANNGFLWDVIWTRKLEAWKQRHGSKMVAWFTAIGECEAACSLAALHHARPEWPFASLRDTPGVVGEALAHPLLPPDACVSNPIDLQGPGQVMLITGSNMSGKSTYLRTVGVNILLGLAGAPVCARALSLSQVQLATSMRTADNLEESTSSFYAELKRLRMVIERVEAGEPVFFLLDEILKGTNSRDRHTGARALIHQLHAQGAMGLVSTHDLELQDLEQELKGAVRNFSFNCDVRTDGTLDFDYTLTDGVCESMNATALMRNMGIKGI